MISKDYSAYQHIRGCILVDLSQDLLNMFEIAGDGDSACCVQVVYQDLPTPCHLCQQEGHLPRTRPFKAQVQKVLAKIDNALPPQQAHSIVAQGPKEAEFVEVCKRKAKSKVKSQVHDLK
jgi:hypothetical protein